MRLIEGDELHPTDELKLNSGMLKQYFSSSAPKIRNPLHAPPRDFVFYIVNKTPLNPKFFSVLWIVMCFQVLFSSYNIILIKNEKNNTTEFVDYIYDVFLAWGSESTNFHIVRAFFYCHVIDLVFYWQMIHFFMCDSQVNKIFCYVYMVFDSMISTILAPIDLYSCGCVLNAEKKPNFSIIAITLLTIVLQLSSLVRYIIYRNYAALSRYLYRNDVYASYFGYLLFISVVSMIGSSIFKNNYILIVLGFLSLLFAFSCFYRPQLFNSVQASIANSVALSHGILSILFYFIDTARFRNMFLWGSIIVESLSITLFYFIFRYVHIKALRDFRDKDFVEKTDNSRVATHVFGVAARACIPEFINGNNIEPFYKKYNDDTTLWKYLTIAECSLSKYPENLKNKFVYSFHAAISPISYGYFIELFHRIKGPLNENEYSDYGRDGRIVEKGIMDTLEAMNSVIDIIFHESSSIIQLSSLKAANKFKETKMRSLSFIQKYPMTPLANVFIEFLRVLSNQKETMDEVDFWSEYVYKAPLTSNYPEMGLAKYIRNNPDAFCPKRADFPKPLTDASEAIVQTLKKLPQKRTKYSSRRGPFGISTNRPFLIIALILLIIVPAVFYGSLLNEDCTTRTIAEKIVNGYDMIQNITFIGAMMPFYMIPELGNFQDYGKQFQEKAYNVIISSMEKSSTFFDSVSDVGNNVSDVGYFNSKVRGFLIDPNSKKDGLSNKDTLHNILFTCIEAVLDETNVKGTMNNYSMYEVYNELDSFCLRLYNCIFSTWYFRHKIADIKMSTGAHSILIVIIASVILITIEFIVSAKRAYRYYVSLNTLSKSAIIKLKSRINAISESMKGLDEFFKTVDVENTEKTRKSMRPFSLVKMVIIPSLIFAVFASVILFVPFAIYKCRTSAILNSIDVLGYFTMFCRNISRVAFITHSSFFHVNIADDDYVIDLAKNSRTQLRNFSYTESESISFCNDCYSTYNQVFQRNNSTESDVANDADLYLVSVLNYFMYFGPDAINSSGIRRIISLFHKDVITGLFRIDENVKNNINENIDRGEPWIRVFVGFYFMVLLLYLLKCQQSILDGDIPFQLLNSILTNLEVVDVTAKTSLILDNVAFDNNESESKLPLQLFNNLRKKLNQSIIVIDTQSRILSFNEEAAYIFVSTDSMIEVPLFEALKIRFLEQGTKRELLYIINQYIYGSMCMVKTFHVYDSENESNTYELLVVPIYQEGITSMKAEMSGLINLVLIFAENREYSMLNKLIHKFEDLPSKIMDDWMHPVIARHLNQTRSLPFFVCKEGLVALIEIFNLSILGNGDTDQTIFSIDKVFQRLDIIVERHKRLAKYRTQSSIYAFGINVLGRESIGEIDILDSFICLSELIDEVRKYALSKRALLPIKASIATGCISIGLPGPQHPWLECWGEAMDGAIDNLSCQQKGVIITYPSVIDQVKDIGKLYDIKYDDEKEHAFLTKLSEHK